MRTILILLVLAPVALANIPPDQPSTSLKELPMMGEPEPVPPSPSDQQDALVARMQRLCQAHQVQQTRKRRDVDLSMKRELPMFGEASDKKVDQVGIMCQLFQNTGHNDNDKKTKEQKENNNEE